MHRRRGGIEEAPRMVRDRTMSKIWRKGRVLGTSLDRGALAEEVR